MQPTAEVAGALLAALADTTRRVYPIPLSGTFAITITAPSVDSMVVSGTTTGIARTWSMDIVRDQRTGIPIAWRPLTFAVDITTARFVGGVSRDSVVHNMCSPVPIIISALPIALADSAWSGEYWPGGFFQCAPSGSPLFALSKSAEGRAFMNTKAIMTFRAHADGRVTLSSETQQNDPRIVVRGERISTVTSRPSKSS